MYKSRCFIPETERIIPERTIVQCHKPDNHTDYKPLNDIHYDQLPDNWRIPDMIKYLKFASRRIVHLTVLKQSPSRICRDSPDAISCGTGYLTFHPVHGAIVHTSKHVVYDPYEVERTIIRLYYDDEDSTEVKQAISQFIKETLCKLNGDENPVKRKEQPSITPQCPKTCGLFISLGSCHHFQSVMCSDYTSFSCSLPIHELFSENEIRLLSNSFSWSNFSVRKFLFSPAKDIEVAVISHPHGYQKVISFGRMNRLCNVTPALHSAATCGGSSGAPLIRLKPDGGLISIGQFVHHGHNRDVLDLGVGTVRPPVTLPYVKCLDTENKLTNVINILYEPILYWTLFFCDLLQLESTFTNIIDVFAYTSSMSALVLTVESTPFKFLLSCYCLHLILSLLINSIRTGLYYGVCNTCSTLISMCMFPAAWLILAWCPCPWTREVIAIVVWITVLYLERYLFLTARFRMRTMGSFTEVLQLKLLYELGIKAKASKRSQKLITNFIITPEPVKEDDWLTEINQ